MNTLIDRTSGDFQKLLHIALEHLEIQQTIIENRLFDLAEELPTLERDEEMERLDRQIMQVKADYAHYKNFIVKGSQAEKDD